MSKRNASQKSEFRTVASVPFKGRVVCQGLTLMPSAQRTTSDGKPLTDHGLVSFVTKGFDPTTGAPIEKRVIAHLTHYGKHERPMKPGQFRDIDGLLLTKVGIGKAGTQVTRYDLNLNQRQGSYEATEAYVEEDTTTPAPKQEEEVEVR